MVANILNQQFADAIDQSRRIAVDEVIECYLADPSHLTFSRDEFFQELEHSFNCLVIKIFVEVVESDLVWTAGEGSLAQLMCQNLLRQHVSQSNLAESFKQLSEIGKQTVWQQVVKPLKWFDETRIHFEEFKSAIMKFANIVAKIDGKASDETISQLKLIRWQLDQHLPTPAVPPIESPVETSAGTDAEVEKQDSRQRLSKILIGLIESETESPADQQEVAASPEICHDTTQRTDEDRESQLRAGLAELDSLIGIEEAREEVRTLINVCKLQQYRASHDMTVKPVSLHMVFTGNPGTGKTTVARIFAKLLGAMGIIGRGHLVETDRSGLVAEYMGQTAKKTNEKVDEAMDGVLFIDEAYSLAPETQADAYGQEAIQTLLKRMEDDRDRLVVILAGYTRPMDVMLTSNPGLTSRFSRRCHFPDFGPDELVAIFEHLAEQNQYRLSEEFRRKLMQEINRQVATKDEHFGNGRTVRNLFEQAIRNLANRVVASASLTPDLLSTFQSDDIADTAAQNPRTVATESIT